MFLPRRITMQMGAQMSGHSLLSVPRVEVIDARFHRYHREHPEVLERIVALAREWSAAGHDKCSMELIFARLRWEQGLAENGGHLSLNDHFTSRYARLVMATCDDLCDFFNIRAIRGEQLPHRRTA